MSKKETKEKKETQEKKQEKWIQSTDMKKGAFTAKAKRKGITSAQLQENVLSNPDNYDETTVKQANLRKTLVGLHNKKKTKTTET
jgi:hypothetical protein